LVDEHLGLGALVGGIELAERGLQRESRSPGLLNPLLVGLLGGIQAGGQDANGELAVAGPDRHNPPPVAFAD